MKNIIIICFFVCFVFCPFVLWGQSGYWEEIHPEVSPTARQGYGLAPIGEDLVLLFGGVNHGTLYDDTWIFDVNLNTWIQFNPQIKPLKRVDHQMCRLSKDKVLLFGGENSKGYALDDTWIFNFTDTSWTKIVTEKSPTKRDHTHLSQIRENEALLFGGVDANMYHRNDTWIFDGEENEWINVLFDPWVDKRPHERSHGMMTSITGENKVILYGGWVFHLLNDTWIFDADIRKWRELNPVNTPDPIASSAMCELTQNQFLLFGGDDKSFLSNKSWIFSLKDTNWYELKLNNKPSSRSYHQLVKIRNGLIILFSAGTAADDVYQDTWLFHYEPNSVSTPSPPKISKSLIVNIINKNILELELISSYEVTIAINIINSIGQIKQTTITFDITKGFNRILININDYSPGLYFLIVTNGSHKYLRKFIL